MDGAGTPARPQVVPFPRPGEGRGEWRAPTPGDDWRAAKPDSNRQAPTPDDACHVTKPGTEWRAPEPGGQYQAYGLGDLMEGALNIQALSGGAPQRAPGDHHTPTPPAPARAPHAAPHAHPHTRGRRGWGNQDLADLTRARRLLALAGIELETDHGLSDDGDPWFVFIDRQGEVFAHFARIGGRYVLDSSAQSAAVFAPDLRALVEAFARHGALHGPAGSGGGPLAPADPAALTAAHEPQVIPMTRGHRRADVRVHPGAVLAALVWSIYIASDELALPAAWAGTNPGARAGDAGDTGAGADDTERAHESATPLASPAHAADRDTDGRAGGAHDSAESTNTGGWSAADHAAGGVDDTERAHESAARAGFTRDGDVVRADLTRDGDVVRAGFTRDGDVVRAGLTRDGGSSSCAPIPPPLGTPPAAHQGTAPPGSPADMAAPFAPTPIGAAAAAFMRLAPPAPACGAGGGAAASVPPGGTAPAAYAPGPALAQAAGLGLSAIALSNGLYFRAGQGELPTAPLDATPAALHEAAAAALHEAAIAAPAAGGGSGAPWIEAEDGAGAPLPPAHAQGDDTGGAGETAHTPNDADMGGDAVALARAATTAGMTGTAPAWTRAAADSADPGAHPQARLGGPWDRSPDGSDGSDGWIAPRAQDAHRIALPEERAADTLALLAPARGDGADGPPRQRDDSTASAPERPALMDDLMDDLATLGLVPEALLDTVLTRLATTRPEGPATTTLPEGAPQASGAPSALSGLVGPAGTGSAEAALGLQGPGLPQGVIAAAPEADPARFATFDDDAHAFLVFLMSKGDETRRSDYDNEVLLVDLDAFDDPGDAVYARSWSFEDQSVISTIGLKSDFDAFGLVV